MTKLTERLPVDEVIELELGLWHLCRWWPSATLAMCTRVGPGGPLSWSLSVCGRLGEATNKQASCTASALYLLLATSPWSLGLPTHLC